MQHVIFELDRDFVELNQLLKLTGLCDSGGAGKFRGGNGVEVKVRPLENVFLSRNTDRIKCPPWGLLGGADGAVNETRIERNGNAETLPGKFSHLLVKPGETVTFLTAGGGGYGDPRARDRGLVREELRDGLISPGVARDVYGLTDRDDQG